MQSRIKNKFWDKTFSFWSEKRMLFVIQETNLTPELTFNAECLNLETREILDFKLERISTYLELIKNQLRQTIQHLSDQDKISIDSQSFITRIKLLIGSPVSEVECFTLISKLLKSLNPPFSLDQTEWQRFFTDQNKILETLSLIIAESNPQKKSIIDRLKLIIPREFYLPKNIPTELITQAELLSFYIEQGLNIQSFDHFYNNILTGLSAYDESLVKKILAIAPEEIHKLRSFKEEHQIKKKSILSGTIKVNDLPDIDTYCPQCSYTHQIEEITTFVRDTFQKNPRIFNAHVLGKIKDKLSANLIHIEEEPMADPETEKIIKQAREETLILLEKAVFEQEQKDVYQNVDSILKIDFNLESAEKIIAQNIGSLQKIGIPKIIFYLETEKVETLIQKLRDLSNKIKEPQLQNKIPSIVETLESEFISSNHLNHSLI